MTRIKSIFALLIISAIYHVDASKEEAEIFEKILTNYSTLVRPVPDPSMPLTVYIKVHLQQIITLEMKDQTMEVNAWIRYEWNDYQLRWKPENYANITSIRVNGGEESQIWNPDIILWNSCDDEHFDSRFTVNAVVYYDGTVNYIPPGVFKITCKVDITWFPFDEQTCYMHFSSWTYHKGAIDLQLTGNRENEGSIDTSTFVKNGQWHLVDAPAYREEKVFTCCPEVYPSVKFYVHLRRRTLYYIFNVIIPSIIITLMTLITFILPPQDMSEKIGHQTTIVLSVSFFLTVVAEMTPPTSESVPLLAIFFSTVTCIVSASAAFTITVLNLRYRQPGNHFISHTFRRIFCEILPWMMLMKRPGYQFRRGRAMQDKPTEVICVKCTDDYATTVDMVKGSTENDRPKSLLHVLARVPAARLSLERKVEVGEGLFAKKSSIKSIKEFQREKFINRTYNESMNAKDELTSVGFSILEAYMSIQRKIEYLRQIHKKRKKRMHLQEEWKFAAMAFDRFLLLIFSTQLTISMVGLCYFAPYFDAV